MELHNDDKPVGRVLTRREVLKLLGGGAIVLIGGPGLVKMAFAQGGTPTPKMTDLPLCVVRPAMTEGPYFVDEDLNRFDIRADSTSDVLKEGIPLHLKFIVSQINADTCMPLPQAQVDIWHCDALGAYSDVSDRQANTIGENWLRGYQVTDADGVAEFITIYPGWYPGRTVHIHFKIRTEPENDAGYEFTSQLFFPEDISDEAHLQEPYAERGYRNTLNQNDGIYRSGGAQLLLDLSPISETELSEIYGQLQAKQETEMETATDATPTPKPAVDFKGRDGYTASFTIGLDLSQPAQFGQGGQAPGRS